MTRGRMLNFFAKLPPCLVGIEACASAHYWARELVSLGHDVKLMPAQYVKPYVKLCPPKHNLTNHEVAIMRRNAA